jgi:hypothetical protein
LILFLLKIFAAGILIALASHLAGKNPSLAGFIIALPLTSMIAILFAYLEHHDMNKLTEFSISILVSVPLSLVFFLPFVLSKWIKFPFPITFLLGIAALAGSYGVQQWVITRLR